MKNSWNPPLVRSQYHPKFFFLTRSKKNRESVIEIVSAIKKEYMNLTPAQRKETLILTATNADRVKINDAIRAERIKQGEIEQGKEFFVISDCSITNTLL